MRFRLVIAALIFAIFNTPCFASSSPPAPGRVVGDPCTTLGTTAMADDRHTLVACMLRIADSTSTGASCEAAAAVGNSCVWKSMMSQDETITWF
jgi:hypothetical protein